MKAKNRKPPDACIYARVEAMPAVGCSCIFEEVLPIVAVSQQREDELKKMARVQKRINIVGLKKNERLNHQKQSVAKRLPIFALVG